MATLNMKSKQLEILLHDFELMSKTALLQMQIVNRLTEDNSQHELIEEAKANEIIMDRLDLKIREEVVFTILQFNPVASDLRRIITYQDIATNLERVGDMLLNIVYCLCEVDIDKQMFAKTRGELLLMLKYSHQMLRDAITSFSAHDSTPLAYQVIDEDDKVDDLLVQIELSLQDVFDGKQVDRESVEAIIKIYTIAHNIERIADSATNIAEAAIYLTDGKDIRHSKLDEEDALE